MDNNQQGSNNATPAPFSLDTAFDMNAVPEADRTIFGDAKIEKIGDLVNYTRDLHGKATAAPQPFGFDSKLDLSKLDGDTQKMFGAKKIETVQGLIDMAVNGEKMIGSLGGKTMKPPEPGKLVDYFKSNAEQFKVPATADAYDWKKPDMPEGFEFDDAMEREFKTWAHERGLPSELFQDFGDFGSKMLIGLQQAQAAAVMKEVEVGQSALKQDWGNDFTKNVEIAQMAARQFGLGDDVIGKVNAEIGAPATIKLLHALGSKMDGASLITGDGASAATQKDQAQQKLDAMMGNPALTDSSHPQHATMVAEQERLLKIVSA